MLANAAHSPAWRSQGYVCLACRRQRLISHRRHQRRSTSTAAADTFFDGFNDISETYSSKPKKPVEVKATRQASAQKKEKSKESVSNSLAALTASLDASLPGGGQKIRETKSEQQYSPFAKSELEDTSFHKDTPKGLEEGTLKEESRGRLWDTLSESGAQKDASGGKKTSQDLIRQLRSELNKQDGISSSRNENQSLVRAPEDVEGPRTKTQPSSTQVKSSQRGRLRVRTHLTDLPVVRKWSSPPPPFNAVQNQNEEVPVTEQAPASSDRPMGLVERYLEKKSQKLPWGVSSVSNSSPSTVPSSLDLATLRKHVAASATSAHSKTISNANEPSRKSEKTSFPQQPETIESLMRDMNGRTDPEHSVTEMDVAAQGESMSGPTSKEGENEVSTTEKSTADRPASPSDVQEESVQDQASEGAAVEAPPSETVESARAEDESAHYEADQSRKVEKSALGGLPSFQASSRPAENSTEQEGERSRDLGRAYASLTSLYEKRAPLPAAMVNISTPSPEAQEMQPTESEQIGQRPQTPQFARALHTKNSKATTKAGDRATKKKDGASPTRSYTSTQRQSVSQSEEQSTESAAEEPEETPSNAEIKSIEPGAIEVKPLDVPQPPVPFLEYGLDRVLFNPGVYQLQDPASRVYNFDPYLQKIMPVVEFDFDALKEYKTSSQDHALAELAKAQKKRYIGSTSSMTSSLAHFHYLLSNWRPVNLSMLTDGFVGKNTKDNFTEINRAPSAIFLRWKDGTYAIDADKEYDGANVLMLLGKSMELLFTLPTSDYERYRKSDPRQVPEAERTAPESYKYTTMRDFLMRSQLDAYDPRLPGNGTFDLKTRAVVSVRMSASDFEPMTGYEIFGLHGKWGSYEREYYDMMRATMLKYMLQARMGQMNGIFVAYHNVKRIFGFQYIPMHEMDRALHGQTDSCLGDQEFKASLEIMNELFNKATEKFPGQSLRFHFETQAQTRDGMPTALHVFAEPMSEEDIDRIQTSQKAKVEEFERNIMGKNTESDENEQSKAASRKGRTEASESSSFSTNSDADTSFLSSITSRKSEGDLRPLFYATVIVQSKVNGDTPHDDRPKNLKREDKWEIDYIIKDYEITPHEWALYEDCRARRKYAFTERDDEDGGDPESEGKSKAANSFINLLKNMAADGKAFRDRVDGMEAGKEILRADQPLPKQRETIDGVEDYMAWMYRSK